MQIQKDFESIARCNIINIIIAQWAKLRKKIATFLSLFIFTTFSVHTFTWCGKSLLGITKVSRNIRLTHIHYLDAGAFTNYRIDMTHFSVVLPQLSNLFLKSTVSELLPFTNEVYSTTIFWSTSFLSTLCLAIFCDFYHFVKLIICINCHNLRNFYSTQKCF